MSLVSPCLLLLQAQLEEELEFKNEEIAKLKDHLSHVERGKVKLLFIIVLSFLYTLLMF